MNEQAYCLVDVLERLGDRNVKISVTHQDGTVDQLVVERYKLFPIEGNNSKRAWLKIEYVGEHAGLASIELPSPILNRGKRMTVNTARIKKHNPREIMRAMGPPQEEKVEEQEVPVPKKKRATKKKGV